MADKEEADCPKCGGSTCSHIWERDVTQEVARKLKADPEINRLTEGRIYVADKEEATPCPNCGCDGTIEGRANQVKIKALEDALRELYNMVNAALDARDALLISKTCATMDKVRAALSLVAPEGE